MPNSLCPWLARGGQTIVAPRRATVTYKREKETKKVNGKNKRSRPIVCGHGIVVGVDGARFGVHVGDRHVVIDISVGRVGLGCISQGACRNSCGAGLNRAFGGSGAFHGCKCVKLGGGRWKIDGRGGQAYESSSVTGRKSAALPSPTHVGERCMCRGRGSRLARVGYRSRSRSRCAPLWKRKMRIRSRNATLCWCRGPP